MKSEYQTLLKLKTIVNLIKGEKDIQVIVKSILNKCQELFDYAAYGLFLKESEKTNFTLLRSLPENLFKNKIPNTSLKTWLEFDGTKITQKSLVFERNSSRLSGLLSESSKSRAASTTLISFLQKNGSIDGFLVVLSQKIPPFQSDDILTFELVSKYIHLALANRHVIKNSGNVYQHVAKEIFPELTNNKRVTDELVQCALKLTGAESGCIARYDKYERTLKCGAGENCILSDKKYDNCWLFKTHSNKNLLADIFRTQNGDTVVSVLDPESDLSRQGQIQTQVAVPLFDTPEIPIGTLILNSQTKTSFNPQDIEILKALTQLGVSALKNSHLLFANQKMIKKLSLLSEATNTLLSGYENQPLEKKFDFIVEKTTEILDAELCTLWLVRNGHIEIETSFGLTDGLGEPEKIDKKQRLPIISEPKAGLHGYIADTKKVQNLYGDALRNHPAIRKQGSEDFLSTEFPLSSLNYPMLDENGELLGLLCAYNKRDEYHRPVKNRGFSKEFDEPLLKILTTKLIISIKNNQILTDLSTSLGQLKKYKLIVENTPDPVVITNRTGTITYMNIGAHQLFGDLIDKKVFDRFYGDEISTSRQKAYEVMRKLKESPDDSIKDFETVYCGINGEPIPLSLSAKLLKDEQGNRSGTIGISKDLRKLKAQLDIGNSLLTKHTIDDILNKITYECLKLSKSRRAYIKLYDQNQDQLVFRAISSLDETEKLPQTPVPKNRGMTGYVFMTQHWYLSGDVSKEPPEKFYQLFPKIKSKICVPINSTDKFTGNLKTLGVISIDSGELNAYSVNDTFFLNTLANQAAAALENALLISSKTKIINDLSALGQIQEKITKTLDPDQILDSVLDVVVKKLGFDYATISKVSPSSGTIATVKGVNVHPDLLKMATHPLNSNDIQAWVVRNKQEEILSEWDDRLDRDIYDRFDHQNLIRVYLPIFTRHKVIGTLETGYQKTHRQKISPDELGILRKVVELAGIGIEQAFLLREQQKLVAQLQVLNQASINIQTVVTEAEIVAHIFKSLQQIGYTKGMLSLVNEQRDLIEGRYALGENWIKIKEHTKRSLTGNDILSIVIREKQPRLSKDCLTDPVCDELTVQMADLRSQYVIPLIIEDKAIGTLQIDLSDKQGLVKGPEDVLEGRMEVLDSFAGQIAIALRNLRDRQIINRLETRLMETAHEFRSPLHNIVTQIGGLRSTLPEGYINDKEIDEIFKIIDEEANRASKQMENSLMFSERSRELVGYNFEKGLIQEVIQHCIQNYRLRALDRGISIIIRDSVKKLPAFIFDKHKIEQVVNNLIDNAMKYSHYQRPVNISGFDDGTQIHIEFWDKGLGIPENEFDNIFEGLYRGEIKDNRRYIPGTGIGLKVSKEIIAEHRGEIKVKSTPFFNDQRRINDYDGYDTIFTIILPKKQGGI